MLGRVLSGPALFLMERGAEDGFSGSKEAGLIRGGFSPEKEKAPCGRETDDEAEGADKNHIPLYDRTHRCLL